MEDASGQRLTARQSYPRSPKMNTSIAASLILYVAMTLASGCANKRITVAPGEFKKLYSSEGLYAEMFTLEENPKDAMVTISSDDYPTPQMVAYYDGEKLEKVMVIRDGSALVMNIDGELHDPQSYTIKTMKESEGKRESIEYRLESIEAEKQARTNQTDRDNPITSPKNSKKQQDD